MTCQHCNARPADFAVSPTEATPYAWLVCNHCFEAHAVSEFADVAPLPILTADEPTDPLEPFDLSRSPFQPSADTACPHSCPDAVLLLDAPAHAVILNALRSLYAYPSANN